MLAHLLYGYLLCIQGLHSIGRGLLLYYLLRWCLAIPLGLDNKRQFPRLLFCVNLKEKPNDGNREASKYHEHKKASIHHFKINEWWKDIRGTELSLGRI